MIKILMINYLFLIIACGFLAVLLFMYNANMSPESSIPTEPMASMDDLIQKRNEILLKITEIQSEMEKIVSDTSSSENKTQNLLAAGGLGAVLINSLPFTTTKIIATLVLFLLAIPSVGGFHSTPNFVEDSTNLVGFDSKHTIVSVPTSLPFSNNVPFLQPFSKNISLVTEPDKHSLATQPTTSITSANILQISSDTINILNASC